MLAELRTAAESIRELKLVKQDAEPQFIRSVESELVARYGAEVGKGLCAEFLNAFNS
jgi:hypothetical protein